MKRRGFERRATSGSEIPLSSFRPGGAEEALIPAKGPRCPAPTPRFSCTSSSRPKAEGAVKAYIAGQAEHHNREDFKSELLRMLRLHEVEFDEKYVFD